MKIEKRSYRCQKFENGDCWYENYQVCVDRKWTTFALWFVGGIDEQGHEEGTDKVEWENLADSLEDNAKMKKNLESTLKKKKELPYEQLRIDK